MVIAVPERDLGALLALDARPTAVPRMSASPVHRCLDRGALARDEPRLRQVFGLLVHAHYRTTPSDLTRLLDGPNLHVHVLEMDDEIVAVNLVAEEGALPPTLVADAASGRVRLQGQALADTLITHAGRPDAGGLRMLLEASGSRSTRPCGASGSGAGSRMRCTASTSRTSLARSSGRRRRCSDSGVPRATCWCASAARGDRTGEPAAVMVRPESDAAHEIVDSLRDALARNLPIRIDWMAAEAPLDPHLRASFAHGLPEAPPLPDSILDAELAGYLDGPRTSDSVAAALDALFSGPCGSAMSGQDRALVAARFGRRTGWAGVAEAAGLPGVRAAQRRLREIARRWKSARQEPPGESAEGPQSASSESTR